jgi:hypothetical protein
MPPILLPALIPALMLAAAADPAEDQIEVAAQRLTRAQIRASAQIYTRAGLPPNPDFGQFARWQGPICASVRGIPDPAVTALVLKRVNAVVAETGLKAAEPGCKPNLTIAFTDDARGLVAEVRSRKRSALPRYNPTLFSRLDSPSLPVRWWHVLAPAGPGGGTAATPDAGALASASSNATPLGNVLPAGPDAIGTNSWNSSLIDTNLTVSAKAGVAVVDVNLATGVSLEALADYVALVMVAPMRMPPGDPGVPSVLGLFTGARPAGLTDWDRAFVRALYKVQMNRSFQRQRQQLLNAMAADLAPGADPDQP